MLPTVLLHFHKWVSDQIEMNHADSQLSPAAQKTTMKKKPCHAISFNSSRSALVKSPMFLSSNWMHLALVLSPPSNFWHIYHISMSPCLCHSVDHARFPGPLRTPKGGVIWLIFPYSDNFLLSLPCYLKTKTSLKQECPTTAQAKNIYISGRVPCARHRLPMPVSIWQVPALWRQTWSKMGGVTFSKCHMSSEFYVTLQIICQEHKKSLRPRIMLYRPKIIIKIILFKAKLRFREIYDWLEHKE